jgi:hypothetical protein
MKARIAVVALLLAVVCAATLSAHDMFIKLDSYFLAPGDTLRVPILNGTFTKSENGIEFERVSQVLLLSPDGFSSPAPLAWWPSPARMRWACPPSRVSSRRRPTRSTRT